MKHLKSAHLFFLIMLSSYVAQSQNSNKNITTHEIVYDFNTGEFKDSKYVENGKLKGIPENEFAVIKVINVNTFRFNVEISGQSIEYVTQVPSELQAIFRLPDQAANNKQTTNALNETQTANSIVSNTNQNIQTQRALFLQSVNSKKSADKIISRIQKILPAQRSAKDKADLVQATTTSQQQTLLQAAAPLSAGNDDFAIAFSNFNDAARKFTDLTTEIADIKFTRVKLIDLSKQDWSKYEDLKAKVDLLNVPTEETMTTDFHNFTQYYANVISLAGIAQEKAADGSDDLKKITDALKSFNDGYAKLTEDDFLNIIRDVIVLDDALTNQKAFSVTSPPIQVDGDFVDFTIKATPAAANDLLNYIPTKSFPVEIPVKGGWKVDFSVGPTISTGKNSRDDKYYLAQTAYADSSQLKSRDNNNVVSPGIAAMMHFYPRTGGSISIGGLFGVGAGFQNATTVDVNLYLGFSGVIGKRQKIMANLGVGYLRVDRLKGSEFQANSNYLTSQIDISNVTEKVFRPSFFFGISYNITNKVEIN